MTEIDSRSLYSIEFRDLIESCMRCSDYTQPYFNFLAFNFIFSKWYHMLKSYLLLINLICKISTNKMNILLLQRFIYTKKKNDHPLTQPHFCILFLIFSSMCFCKHSYIAHFYTSSYPVYKMQYLVTIFRIAVYLCHICTAICCISV